MIEIAPIPLDAETGLPRKTIASHAETSVDAMAANWDDESPWRVPFYIDTYEVASEEGDGETSGPELVYENAEQRGLDFIPVVGLRRSEIEHQAAEQHSDLGLCVRLEVEDYETRNLSGNLRALLNRHELKPGSVDLMIDLKDSGMNSSPGVVRRLAIDLINSTPTIKNWRNLILAGCSFPQGMQGIQAGQVHRLNRTEWHAWQSLFDRRADLPRMPIYSDYAIQHPEMVDFDPIMMQASATIRFTSENHWILVRGFGVRNRRHGGYDQFHRLAQTLTELDEFVGSDHCEGCGEIVEISQRSDRPGNLSTWRKIGTCHHLTLVTEQLSVLDGDANLGAS